MIKSDAIVKMTIEYDGAYRDIDDVMDDKRCRHTGGGIG